MKFTVHVLGADNGLIDRLTAAADRKLAPKLQHAAQRHARVVRTALRLAPGALPAHLTTPLPSVVSGPDTAAEDLSSATSEFSPVDVSASVSPEADVVFDVPSDTEFL